MPEIDIFLSTLGKRPVNVACHSLMKACNKRCIHFNDLANTSQGPILVNYSDVFGFKFEIKYAII